MRYIDDDKTRDFNGVLFDSNYGLKYRNEIMGKRISGAIARKECTRVMVIAGLSHLVDEKDEKDEDDEKKND